MKTKLLFPLLFSLVLTGCGAQANQIDPASSEVTAETTVAETTETEITAETETETTTEQQTEAPTATTPPAAITEDAQKAYRYVRDELIPQYGLSDMKPYEPVNWDFNEPDYGGITPPEETQGIISAFVEDMTADGIPELLTIRAEEYDFILEWYNIQEDTPALIASHTVAGGYVTASITPTISFKNGRIIVYSEKMGLPGCSNYGNDTFVLELKDGEVNQLCSFGGYRWPGTLNLYVNDQSVLLEEGEDDDQIPEYEEAAASELKNAGVEAASVSAGWDDLCYGIYPVFEDAVLLFDIEDDNLRTRYFTDHTGLRDRLAQLDSQRNADMTEM